MGVGGATRYDLRNIDNLFSHLTNSSINKHSPQYETHKDVIGSGCKWTLLRLKKFISQKGVQWDKLWVRIRSIIVLTLSILMPHVPETNGGCFELLGFDGTKIYCACVYCAYAYCAYVYCA